MSVDDEGNSLLALAVVSGRILVVDVLRIKKWFVITAAE